MGATQTGLLEEPELLQLDRLFSMRLHRESVSEPVASCVRFPGRGDPFPREMTLRLVLQPGASLEQTHIFVLAHILRRPIIVYGVKFYKSFRGETLGYTRFQGEPLRRGPCSREERRAVAATTANRFDSLFPGVYLPLLWEQSFCWKSPIALGYTRGHFSALVAMENDGYGGRGAGANLNTDDDVTITFLPLVDSERKLLHVHFLSAQEVRPLGAGGRGRDGRFLDAGRLPCRACCVGTAWREGSARGPGVSDRRWW